MSLEQMITWISTPPGLIIAGLAVASLVGIEIAMMVMAFRSKKNKDDPDGRPPSY